jgi:hypothetical protein
MGRAVRSEGGVWWRGRHLLGDELLEALQVLEARLGELARLQRRLVHHHLSTGKIDSRLRKDLFQAP